MKSIELVVERIVDYVIAELVLVPVEVIDALDDSHRSMSGGLESVRFMLIRAEDHAQTGCGLQHG